MTKEAFNLTTAAARARLKVRKAAYFVSLGTGMALGFVRGPDSWTARFRPASAKEGASPKQEYQYIELPPGTSPADAWDKARGLADAWFKRMGGAVVRAPIRGTVQSGLLAYVKNMRDENRNDAAETALNKFRAVRLVPPKNWDDASDGPFQPDPFALLMIESVTKDATREFRERWKGGRDPKTTNRYMRQVVAGLNNAVRELGFVGNPEAWRIKGLSSGDNPDNAEDNQAIFLGPERRAAVAKVAIAELRDFLAVGHAGGLRPNETAILRVKHYDAAAHTLRVFFRKGKPPEWRSRIVELPEDTVPLFARLTAGRSPEDCLLLDEYGKPWKSHRWGKRVRAAIAWANAQLDATLQIPEEATAYSWRHDRISELLQIERRDAVTVAEMTGTSLAMMKLYYWKFIPKRQRERFSMAA